MRRFNSFYGKSCHITVWMTMVLIALVLSGCGSKDEPVVSSGNITVEKSADIPTASDLGIVVSNETHSGDEDTDDPDDEEKYADGEEDADDDESADAEDTEGTEDGDEADEDEESDDTDEADEDPDEDTNDADETDDTVGPVTPGSVESVGLDGGWENADHAAIGSGSAKLYRASGNRKGVVIAVNAGHGTKGGQSVKTLCHPDGSPKVTGGTTSSGAVKAAAISGGMSFLDGASEASVTLREAQILRDILLSRGYDVLMLRDDADVQLDNVARTVIANNMANCHIAIHWDGDNLSYDKGCFYISTPDGIKGMYPVSSVWQQHEALGQSLISGLAGKGCKIYKGGSMSIDLTQTSYSTIPSVDIELGNAASAHDDATLTTLAQGLADGISAMY